MSGTGRECWYCGFKGHLVKDCGKKAQDERSGIIFTWSSSTGPVPAEATPGVALTAVSSIDTQRKLGYPTTSPQNDII